MLIGAFSHYPAIPPPMRVPLTTLPEHPCPYLPGQIAQSRAIYAPQMLPDAYLAFMDAGFRRSGKLIYQPVCRRCRACQPIRVPVETFKPNKSQRRCWRRNQDLIVTVRPIASSPAARPPALMPDEEFELYCRYQRDWHGVAGGPAETREAFQQFLYDSPVYSGVLLPACRRRTVSGWNLRHLKPSR